MPGLGAAEIGLVSFAGTFAAEAIEALVPRVGDVDLDAPHAQPAQSAVVWQLLVELMAAATAGRADDVARLAERVRERLADEQAWRGETLSPEPPSAWPDVAAPDDDDGAAAC